jgi:hypothetical protein
MRSLTLALLLLGLLARARAGDLAFARIGADWHDAAAFDRISEYFGGGENTGGHTILRTHADARAGFYFLVHFAHGVPPAGAKFELQVIRPDAPEGKTFSFPAVTAAPNARPVFELGLTGADWPGGAKARPAAWRLALLGADGRVLAEQKSFLWENPPK